MTCKEPCYETVARHLQTKLGIETLNFYKLKCWNKKTFPFLSFDTLLYLT
jgi:hypothetical protein